MLVRISKASELTGKSQQTLYRHIASGKLSATIKGTEKETSFLNKLNKVIY